MKRQYVITGILSLGLVFVLALTGCSSDDNSGNGGGLGTINLGVADAPLFTGTAVTTEAEARDLFNRVVQSSSFRSTLTGITSGLLSTAVVGQANQRDFSASVNMDDTTSLAALKTRYPDITAGTIKGSMNGSYKGPINYSDYVGYNSVLAAGDSVSMSSSSNLTYTISEGFASVTLYSGSTIYKVAGTIKTESESSQNYTMKTPATSSYSGSNSSVSKAALALSISDGTKGAKFVISASRSSSGSRNIISNSESNYSDLQVYNNDGALLFTIPGDSFSSSVLNFAN